MKKWILAFFLFWTILNISKGQSHFDSLSTSIRYFLNDSINLETNFGLLSFKNHANFLSRSLRKNAFTRDSSLLELFANIDSIFITTSWINPNGSKTYDLDKLYDAIRIFKHSLFYSHLPLEQVIDSFIMLNNGRLIIRNLLDTMGLTTLHTLMDRYPSCDHKHRLYSSIRNNHKYFYRSLSDRGLSLIKHCDILYYSLLRALKQDQSPIYSEIYQNEVNDFLQNMDTSTIWKQDIYNYLILGKLRPEEIRRDSIEEVNRNIYLTQEDKKRQAWLKRQDSLILAAGGLHSFKNYEIADIEWKLSNPFSYRDSIDVIKVIEFSSLPMEEQNHYLPLMDTTFWKDIDEYFTPLETDDGMRFDTFSNVELIYFLDTLSFSETYPADTPYVYGYQDNTAQVHLHKVCQILGDRRAYGAFTPDSTEQNVVERFIDTLMEFGKLDTPQLISINKRSEARHLMIRLGRLGFPYFVGLITDPPHPNWDRICHPEEIFRQITEEEILQLVSKADAYLAQGDTARAKDIGTDMFRFFSKEVYVEPYARRPRRPIAPTNERQRWADEHIWPLLLRMNHWYTRR